MVLGPTISKNGIQQCFIGNKEGGPECPKAQRHHSKINLFADDTLLSVSVGLASLSKWLKFNKLKLNVIKTK
jgi:hypothetical protein